MNEKIISNLRSSARKLIRELGILQLNMSSTDRAPQHWHSLIEIANDPNITIAKLAQLLVLSQSNISRIVKSLIEQGLVIVKDGTDKREKHLQITAKGSLEIKSIDDFSHIKIKGALEYLTTEEQKQIIAAMQKYADALEKSRLTQEKTKIHTLSTSRTIRKQIINMIENIQQNEFSLAITSDINNCILKAEDEFYFNNSYNFWYATDDSGNIIGSIGLKKINKSTAEIKKFFVAHHYRGKGVSQKLLGVLVKSALKHEFKHLYLGTVDKLIAAQCFYEKYGFIRISKQNLPVNFEICPVDTVFYTIESKELNTTLSSHIE